MKLPLVVDSYYQPKESDFEFVSLKSWTIIMSQILKLFYFIRVNKKSLKGTFEGS